MDASIEIGFAPGMQERQSEADAHASPAAVESFGYRQELKRSLSLFDLLVYGLVFIVPGAPVAQFGIVFNASRGMVPLVYVVGLVAMVFTAVSYVAMTRAFPVAGSVYTYASRSIGETVGFFAGWAMLLDYLLLPTLIYIFCAIAFHLIVPDVPKWAWVILLVGLNTLVNLRGIETTARVSFVLLALQLVVLAITMVLGIVAIAHGTAGAHLSIKPFFNPAVFSPGLIFGALSLAVLSFLGFDAISTLSEEAKGGSRAIGRATILSLGLAAFLFVAQTYISCLFVLDRTSFPKGDATETANYAIFVLIGGQWLKWLNSIFGVVISGVPGALTAQAATARLLYGMARDGKLPRFLSRVHPDRGVPDNAVFLVAAVTLVLGLLLVNRVELLNAVVSFGALSGFFILHCSVLAYAVRNDKLRSWFQFLVAPVMGLLIIGYVLFNTSFDAKFVGICWLVLGAVFLLTLKLSGRSTSLAVEGSSDIAGP